MKMNYKKRWLDVCMWVYTVYVCVLSILYVSVLAYHDRLDWMGVLLVDARISSVFCNFVNHQTDQKYQCHDIGEHEHVKYILPSIRWDETGQKRTNGCTQRTRTINDCRYCGQCFWISFQRTVRTQFSTHRCCDQCIWSIDKNAQQKE